MSDELKIYGAGITAVVALIVSLINVVANRNLNKRTAYINIVVSERIKWCSKLSENISIFYSLLFKVKKHFESNEIVELEKTVVEVRKLQMLIILQLNSRPQDESYQEVIEMLEMIFSDISTNQFAIREKIELLTGNIQNILKSEWDKIKYESIHGQECNQKVVASSK